MRTALIHYFTGTGNTYHAVKLLGEMLSKYEYKIVYINMEKQNNWDKSPYDLNIFAFPVYGFGMPAIAKKYLKGLPTGNQSKACILSIGGQTGHSSGGVLDNAFEGDALITAASILRRKGFDVSISELLGYPENWTQLFNPPDAAAQQRITEEQDQLLKTLVDKIVSDTASLRKPPFLLHIICKIIYWAYTLLGRRILGKIFIADISCCGCSKCSKICPVNNIEMKNMRPCWKWNCEGCQRCINACPRSSIQTSTVRLAMMLAMQFAPIWLVIEFNKTMPVNFIFDIILFVIFTIAMMLAADGAMRLLERLPYGRNILQRNFTSKFRRYLSKDIKF